MTTRAVQKPIVVVHRADRTLRRSSSSIARSPASRAGARCSSCSTSGCRPRRSAARSGCPWRRWSSSRARASTKSTLSADARRWLADEFFFLADQPAQDGFFLLPVTRKLDVKLVVSAEGFVDVAQQRTVGDGLYETVGVIALAPGLTRPTAPHR